MNHKQVDQVIAWAPATIANLNIGFDTLGLALQQPQEKMIARRIEPAKQVQLILEPQSNLPKEALQNVAGRAAQSVLDYAHADFGVELHIEKSILPGSGIGSSAASAVAAVVATSALLPTPLPKPILLECALDGEELASGARHLDNVAASLMGGLILSTAKQQLHALPIPAWHIVVLHPQVEVKTADARACLPKQIPLNIVTQSIALMGEFVHACHLGDAQMAALALQDLFIEPARSPLIPFFKACRELALKRGALSGGISGSGPSSFWLCLDLKTAQIVQSELSQFMSKQAIDHKVYVSSIQAKGAYAIPQS